jgi:hypothetical protein
MKKGRFASAFDRLQGAFHQRRSDRLASVVSNLVQQSDGSYLAVFGFSLRVNKKT